MLVKPVTTILVHKTKQFRYVCVLVAQLNPALYDPMYRSPPGSSDHGTLEARILEWGCHGPFQGIFPTQGLNPGLLNCRQILCHPSHLGSPSRHIYLLNSV